MDDIILEQLTNHFKAMLQEIMLKEREQYLKENSNTRGIMPPEIWPNFLTLYFLNLLRFCNKTTVYL